MPGNIFTLYWQHIYRRALCEILCAGFPLFCLRQK